jgi:hypothetical protein
MPKTAVQEAVCDICGAEVREGSQFCYNCGGSVSKAEEIEPIPPPAEPIVKPDDKPANGNATYDPAKGRSERVEKRKVRAANRQPVEVVWQPREGVSLPFVIASLVFVLIAIVVIVAAFYLR